MSNAVELEPEATRNSYFRGARGETDHHQGFSADDEISSLFYNLSLTSAIPEANEPSTPLLAQGSLSRRVLVLSGQKVRPIEISSHLGERLEPQQKGSEAVQDDRPVWEIVAALGEAVPKEEWAKIPADASVRLDHYLYGGPSEVE